MDSLSSKQTPNAVRKALQTLPTGIFETYTDVLKRIEDQNEDDRQLARKVILWLCLSLRPMSMREIQHAVTIDESYNVLDEDDIPSEEILVAVCAGLINLDTKTGVVQLVHFTAQEYFSQPSVREKLFPDGHRTLFSTCLSYLVLESLGAGLPEQEEGHELDEFMAKHCLLYYAAHNWGHHARKADVDQADQGAILRLLASEQNVILLTDTLHMTPEGQHRRYYPNILTEIDKSGIWLLG